MRKPVVVAWVQGKIGPVEPKTSGRSFAGPEICHRHWKRKPKASTVLGKEFVPELTERVGPTRSAKCSMQFPRAQPKRPGPGRKKKKDSPGAQYEKKKPPASRRQESR